MARLHILRSYALYHLTQLFAPPYSSTAATDLGIPLQIAAPTEMKRATLQTTYQAIIDSLKQALPLLSYKVTDNRMASAPAANALLARVYLSMADYTNAAYHCEKVFYDYGDTLIDYNTVDTSNSQLFLYAPTNREILFNSAFYSDMLGGLRYSSEYMSVDTTLYQQYDSNDLRKNLLFHPNTQKGVIDLKAGGYSDFYDKFFNGLALDEVYLIAAECAARKVNTDYAVGLLNSLLESRYKKGTFTPVAASTSQQALERVLQERRKELVFRGLRWYDLRRLNREGSNITLKRLYNGNPLTLAPNSLLYTFPIPNYIVRQSNGSMVQNARY